jgi:mono/diheme cytochrome c family protein
MKRISLLGVILALIFGCTAWSQEQSSGTPEKKTVKSAPVKSTMPDTGRGLYKELCTSCHGQSGKGDGPAAATFKVPPTDLTALAKKNNGKYPADHVASVLRFGTAVPAHGSSEMPVWGSVLGTSPIHGTDPAKVQLRIGALTDYVETLQVK